MIYNATESIDYGENSLKWKWKLLQKSSLDSVETITIQMEHTKNLLEMFLKSVGVKRINISNFFPLYFVLDGKQREIVISVNFRILDEVE